MSPLSECFSGGLVRIAAAQLIRHARVCVCAGQPLPSSQRQRFYDKPSNLAGAVFRTDLVYTFVINQSIVNMEAYRCGSGRACLACTCCCYASHTLPSTQRQQGSSQQQAALLSKLCRHAASKPAAQAMPGAAVPNTRVTSATPHFVLRWCVQAAAGCLHQPRSVCSPQWAAAADDVQERAGAGREC